MLRASLLCMLLFLGLPALALEAGEQLADPALEARARDLSSHIRCVVCQAESIDESPSLLAEDMRRFVRQELVAGKTDQDVLAALQQRYGDKVLMSPPMRYNTLLLWFGPLVLLLVAFGIALKVWRRHD